MSAEQIGVFDFEAPFIAAHIKQLTDHHVCECDRFILLLNRFLKTEIKRMTTREHVNKFWDHQVGLVRTDSIAIRRCFVNYPEMTDAIWFENFVEFVIPFLKRYNLPRG